MKITTLPNDDSSCGWINTLAKRTQAVSLSTEVNADWTIIGAGFTGLSAARRLTELLPEARVVVVDAQRAGESSSGRNSGFITDVGTSRAGTHAQDDDLYLAKLRLNIAAINMLDELVKRHNIDCQWRQIGKYHCAADEANRQEIESFAAFCRRLNLDHQELDRTALNQRLGTAYYLQGIFTPRAVMVQPAALVRGLFEHLPASITVYEQSPVLEVNYGSTIQLRTPNGSIKTRHLIYATNGFLPGMGIHKRRLMPLTLTASLTRPLSAAQRSDIGDPEDWGVLAAHGMGATVRYTADHRIMMRNTAEYWPRLSMTQSDLAKRRSIHQAAVLARFPQLPELETASTWSGLVCVSSNLVPAFGALAENVYVSGGYNGSGVAGGTIRGRLIVDYALGCSSELLDALDAFPSPGWIPPRPFLDIGALWRLRRAAVGLGRDL
jgi:glycine/D-amino acid oxidase-like deaminating enzyme